MPSLKNVQQPCCHGKSYEINLFCRPGDARRWEFGRTRGEANENNGSRVYPRLRHRYNHAALKSAHTSGYPPCFPSGASHRYVAMGMVVSLTSRPGKAIEADSTMTRTTGATARGGVLPDGFPVTGTAEAPPIQRRHAARPARILHPALQEKPPQVGFIGALTIPGS